MDGSIGTYIVNELYELLQLGDLGAGFSFLVVLAVISFVALNKLLTLFVALSLHRKVLTLTCLTGVIGKFMFDKY